MSGWQNSRSTDKRHEHSTRREADGRDVCISCSQVVVEPIISSDDERLVGAGLYRSEDGEDPFPMPLPQQLIIMYNGTEGAFPFARWVEQVMDLNFPEDTDDLWRRLADKV